MNDLSPGIQQPAADPLFQPTDDPLWLMIDNEFTPAREHEFESMFAVANGYLGQRGSLPFGTSLSAPAVFIAGVFDVIPPSTLPELVAAPGWTLLSAGTASDARTEQGFSLMEHRRILDMRQGVFRREFRLRDKGGGIIRVLFLRLASLADRHLLLQSSLCTSETLAGRLVARSGFVPPSAAAARTFSRGISCLDAHFGRVHVLEGSTQAGMHIALAVAPRLVSLETGVEAAPVASSPESIDSTVEADIETGQTWRYDWVETCCTTHEHAAPAQAAIANLDTVLADGVMPAIQRHVEAWQRRWDIADVRIDGDEDAQRAIRFACYHLISTVNPADEHVSIGARALTGNGYKGHVFWDTETYLLPFYTLTDPASARALLMYRFHTLDAARRKAQRLGYRGALYAWESADTGDDVTPSYATTPVGKVIPVVTGAQAHHISADIAYAVWQYWQATADDGFLCEAGAEILVETARFWASRGRFEGDGLYHIRGVVGPDEYHDGIDDNAYTNWMARWNLECAANAMDVLKERYPEQWRSLAGRLGVEEGEADRWRTIAAAIYDGIDPARGMIEQFAGYFGLEDIDLAPYAQRSLPLDVILGRERTQGSTLIKQADVVMLLALLGHRIAPSMQEACYRYYEPRTEHSSSLSPAIHALLAARLGDTALALRYFRQARDIDLADNMGNASGGVHIAALGGLWQSLVFGFAGLRLDDAGLSLAPHCPDNWDVVRFTLLWRGQRIAFSVTPTMLEIALTDGAPVPVAVGDSPAVALQAALTYRWTSSDGTWKEMARECRQC
ncbi:MAG TPA: glycosyl hydrolase family 65 protein [Noviherbaspirillum sp.]|uniref:glycoside hydrolase family 65 protein n=1 Tax=Noviherbaspirillum sp. TaxID=1926288 RepID=UPI002B4A14BF|nr:glycosyl hydrolase family 65 protein [Noviherbaspirillum sp.]HJV88544.1 glycosyl hydrolase family 65 protein [Noviherbaspirillum sp.]